MSYRLQERNPRDTSGNNVAYVVFQTCSRCHADFDEYDDFDSDFCEDCQGYAVCEGCFATIPDANGKFCAECVAEMAHEKVAAMAR